MLEQKYRVYLAVSRVQSFSKAAAELNLTASAVSHIVSKFEAELGFPLFMRKRNGVILTANGWKVLDHIQRIAREDAQLEKEAAQIRDLNGGVVRLGCYYSHLVNWMTHIIPQFKKNYPNIEISVFQGQHVDVMRWLEDCTIDLAMHTYYDNLSVSFTPLYHDQMMCVAPPDYIPINEGYVTIEDLKVNPVIGQQECTREEAAYFLKNNDIKINSHYHVEDDQSVIALVSAGVGLSIMPELCCRKAISNVKIYPILPSVYRLIGISTNASNTMAPATKALRKEIINYLSTADQPYNINTIIR